MSKNKQDDYGKADNGKADNSGADNSKVDNKVDEVDKIVDDILKEALKEAENPEPIKAAEEAAAPEAESAEQKIAGMEAKLADLNDQYLRKAADFENFRKRMNREKIEITEFANQNLLLDLLPVIDDFERAIKSAETCASLKSSSDFASFYEGVTMIEKRLTSQLESKWGLKRFDSAGQPFDPNFHEAIQMEKSAGIGEATVKEDYLKGYFLKERVIRFAKVKVLVPDSGEMNKGNEQEKANESDTK